MTEVPSPPALRADARRNRDAILAAARDVFAEQGLDAPLDAIARVAGVGRATLYRRFPTREALIGAIFDDNFDRLEAISASVEDPAQAYFHVLRACMDMQAEDRGFTELFARRRPSAEVLKGMNERFQAVTGPPLLAAQAAGHVRPDLLPTDSTLLVDMLGASLGGQQDAEASRRKQERAFTLMLDAISPQTQPRPLST